MPCNRCPRQCNRNRNRCGDARRPDKTDPASRVGRTVRNSLRQAFSLVELIVVMVIIGMLAGLVAVQTRSYLVASKQNAARAEIATISQALESYYADQGPYPTTEEGLDVLVDGTPTFGQFLNKIPLDPWKRPYEYLSPGQETAFEIVCFGEDGEEGGTGADLDISSEALDGRPS